MTLNELKNGESAIIVKVKGRGAFRKRITDMGFTRGKEVTMLQSAPLQDPVAYRLLDYDVSLRRSEAKLIEVLTSNNPQAKLPPLPFSGTFEKLRTQTIAREKGRQIDIALIGNPNCGKTTLFNHASGLHEHVGNYAGVTIESKKGVFRHKGYTINITDLPGTYSLSAYTPEEFYVVKHIVERQPDVVVNVVDASNLERNLFLTTQLIDMDINMVIALNVYDEMEKRGDHFDHARVGKLLGIPIVPTVGAKGRGIEELLDKIIDVYEKREPVVRHIHINYGEEIEYSVRKIQKELAEIKPLTDQIASRYCALKLIEKDRQMDMYLAPHQACTNVKTRVEKEIKRLESLYHEDMETVITDLRYGFVSGALRWHYQPGDNKRGSRNITAKIDKILTHKYLGFPFFLFFLWVMFQSTFTLGSYPMEWIESGVEFLHKTVAALLPDGFIESLLVGGVIDGVGGVIVFLPNILILYFFIALMEDTGYMARTAFITDKLMHVMGLHGRSFIPLVMGFGCNVPAIMATRTIENRNDRLLTMLIVPFMSCSARLPVYLLVAGAIFPHHAGNVVFMIYLIGIGLSVISAIVLKRMIFKANETPFVMELPPYRLPTAKAIVRHMWSRAVQYLQKMGGIILIASIAIWFLSNYPQSGEKQTSIGVATNTVSSLTHENPAPEHLVMLESAYPRDTYIARIGHFIEPVLTPLGFDWRMGVSLLTGIAAKEVVVSTMAVLYQAEDDEHGSLRQKIAAQVHERGPLAGQTVFTPLVAFCFLLFVLLYNPCIAVIAAIRKESGSWRWAIFTMLYTTGFAWSVAFGTYQIGKLLIASQ